MHILDFSEEPLVLRDSDTVSKAVSALMSSGRFEALVFKKRRLKGVLLARDLVKRRFDNPSKAGISKLVKRLNPVPSETSPERLVNSFLVNDYKALPVIDASTSKYLIVTKMGILRFLLKDPVLSKKRAEEVMHYPYCISLDDNVSVARSMFRSLGLSGLPVVSENNRVEGLLDSRDMLRFIIEKKRPMLGESSGEEIHPEHVIASSLMRKDYPKASLETSLRDVVDTMLSKSESLVIVEHNSELRGIITPRDILKVTGGETRGVYVQISGIQYEDPFIRRVVDEEIGNEIRKLAKSVPIDYLALDVDRHKASGSRSKYSVKARLITQKGHFFAKDFAWDLTKAVRGLLAKLEREVIKKKEKSTF